MLRLDGLAGLLLLVGAAVIVVPLIPRPQDREYAAEVVTLGAASPSGEVIARIYAGTRRLRQERIDDGDTVVTIYDLDRDVMVFLDPRHRTYHEIPKVLDGYLVSTVIRIRSRDKPCGSAYRATRLGVEAVDGRMAEKWRCELKRLPKYMEGIPKRDLRLVFVIDPWHIWYDLEHSLMVRYVRHSGFGRELRNVRMAPQPAHLFAVPPDYTKTKAPYAAALDSLDLR